MIVSTMSSASSSAVCSHPVTRSLPGRTKNKALRPVVDGFAGFVMSLSPVSPVVKRLLCCPHKKYHDDATQLVAFGILWGMSTRSSISETVHRYLLLLQLLPRAPRKIDTKTIERLLAEQGFELTRRSIQRDLESLALTFPSLRCDAKHKPYGWAWEISAPSIEFPPIGTQAAVTLDLVGRYLEPLLPRSTVALLDPSIKRARAVLRDHDGVSLARWARKVRVQPRGIRMHMPEVRKQVLDVVYRALLTDVRLCASYRRRGAQSPRDYEINPLGLVVRDGTLVLVCSSSESEDVFQLHLHRMLHAEILSTPARAPRGFDLDRHLQEGGVAFRRGKPFKLRAQIGESVALTLQETPLSSDQTLAARGSDRWQLEATIADTLELRGWIRSYGSHIEVLAPKALRNEMALEAQRTVAMYRSRRTSTRRRGVTAT